MRPATFLVSLESDLQIRHFAVGKESHKLTHAQVHVVVAGEPFSRDFCDPMGYTVHQAPLSMGFPRQEYWSGLPFPSPGDLPRPGIELVSPTLAGEFSTTEPTGKSQVHGSRNQNTFKDK